MTDTQQFVPASAFTLDALADLFTRAFEGYRYAMRVTASLLSDRIAGENIDLHRSLVVLLGGEPAGVALLGLRGAQAWCGGFGIVAAARGRGLAVPLAATMIDQARQAGARRLSLEVLAGNQPALATYVRAGLRAERDLLLLRWVPAEGAPPAVADTALEECAPRELLAHFDALHPAAAAWQRDLPSLLIRGGLRGLALRERGRLAAYALFQVSANRQVQLADLGAADASAAAQLLRGLRAYGAPLVAINEPADSPITSAFLAEGWAEFERQHELAIEL